MTVWSLLILVFSWILIIQGQMNVSISDIQTVEFPNTDDTSPLLHQFVRFTGVVTGIYPVLQIIIIQDPAGGPYSGIVIQSSSVVGDVSSLVEMNDLIQIEGNVTEFGVDSGNLRFGTTNTVASDLQILQKGVDPIQPILVTPGELNPFPNDAERFESVLLKIVDTVASEPIGDFEEFAFYPGDSTGVTIADDALRFLTIPLPEEGDFLVSLTGILFFIVAVDQFQLRPRGDNDIEIIRNNDENNLPVILGGTLGGFFGLVLCCLLIALIIIGLIHIIKKRNKTMNEQLGDHQPNTDYIGMGNLTLDNTSQGSKSDKHGSLSEKKIKESTSTFEIPYSEIQLASKIGEGAYGIVWVGTWRKTQCAIKQLKPDIVTKEIKEVEAFRSEAELMGKLKHPNVIQTLGVVTHPDSPFCIVTEFFQRGSLLSLLQTYSDNELQKTDPLLKLRIASDIATGMVYLHAEGIIHRDLAARNILLTTDCKAKITDFGLSRVLQKNEEEATTKSEVGPLKWMAPESISRRVFSKNSDIWMYGVVLFELISHKQPYGDMDPLQACFEVANERLHLRDCIEKTENVNPVLLKTMNASLGFLPKDRPDFEALLDMLK